MNVMTKRGSLDNNITYEHFCDTNADMININPNYITLGSICIVINGEDDGMEVYMANSNKEWNAIVMGAGSGEGSVSSLMDLLDVSVLNPTDGQTLVYSAEEGKWVNHDSTGGVMVVKSTLDEMGNKTLDHTWQEIYDAISNYIPVAIIGVIGNKDSEMFFVYRVDVEESNDYVSYVVKCFIPGSGSGRVIFECPTPNDYPIYSD